jgi:type IV pilus assembly protein PilA
MTVVAIIGVLAVLAIVGYRRWVRTSYMAEAQDMLQNIRAAEETFKSEAGGYLNASSTLDLNYTYPAATPGAFKSAWGGACGSCANTASWSQLAVEPKGPVAYGYAVVTDNAGTASPTGASVTAATSKMINQPNYSALTAPWFVVEALGDINGDGIYTRLTSASGTNQVVIDGEGE